MHWVIVELDSGEQHYFNRLADGFRYAKEQESKRRHSVEFVGDFYEYNEQVYSGQNLRWLLRSLDNVSTWMKRSNGD